MSMSLKMKMRNGDVMIGKKHGMKTGDYRWVVCDICSLKLHLQCSGISYDIELLFDIDIEY